MDYRKYVILLFIVLCGFQKLKAQDNGFMVADSTSAALSKAGNWQEMINYGHQTLAAGTDFPGLRLRIAFAYFITNNYKEALAEYNRVLQKDAYNQTARYYAYYSANFLNNYLQASYNAGYLDKGTLRKEGVSPFGLLDMGVESGEKFVSSSRRGNGFYTHGGFSNRLGWRLQLEQSVIYYNQDIINRIGFGPRSDRYKLSDDQIEYFAKLSYMLNQNFTLIGSYHYLTTKYNSTIYRSNLWLAGIKYQGTDVDLQGDVNFGDIIKQPITQYNAKLTYYPSGNLNVYTISRLSDKYLKSKDHFIFNQAIGFKIVKNTWLESGVTFGSQEDYLDSDGLYVYNSVDNTKFKFNETAFYQLNIHAQLRLIYTYEQKADAYFPINYNQNSLTLGFLWKF
ncbi:tetratricopeptide repeat protein [Mucilaginibacter jinjuensis]|uniref:Tetratricopeptide repeat protein n=1 Tax=Mucilaginibacter jinjuensis TaxID=1176721 RepID=A0ABY7T836_9SPHI|nr:tetratricopeptide repeat protein [Mucilaginibacter jinjuensis]WCT12571.1 tetratricopeptide repeat protein [Mucilaginibacter jinjuensis]